MEQDTGFDLPIRKERRRYRLIASRRDGKLVVRAEPHPPPLTPEAVRNFMARRNDPPVPEGAEGRGAQIRLSVTGLVGAIRQGLSGVGKDAGRSR